MGCQTVNLPGGARAIVCSRGRRHRERCAWCQFGSMFQCDAPVGSGTCDKHLCAAHADEVGPDRHYCPMHAKAAREATTDAVTEVSE